MSESTAPRNRGPAKARILRTSRAFGLSLTVPAASVQDKSPALVSISKLRQELGFTWNRAPSSARTYRISFRGQARIIDSLYERLPEVEGAENWVLAKDELGEAIRFEAFPMLAEIELSLRDFIKRAMVEVVGVDWWERVVPPDLRTVPTNRHRTDQASPFNQHPLDFTDFDALLALFGAQYQHWQDGRVLSIEDFAECFDSCSTIAEARQHIAKKRKPFSLWEDVFARYFADPERWLLLQGLLQKQVVPFRNRVMHHRHVRLGQLQMLRARFPQIVATLNSAKPRLSRPVGVAIQSQTTEALRSHFLALSSLYTDGGFLKELRSSVQRMVETQMTWRDQIAQAIASTSTRDLTAIAKAARAKAGSPPTRPPANLVAQTEADDGEQSADE